MSRPTTLKLASVSSPLRIATFLRRTPLTTTMMVSATVMDSLSPRPPRVTPSRRIRPSAMAASVSSSTPPQPTTPSRRTRHVQMENSATVTYPRRQHRQPMSTQKISVVVTSRVVPFPLGCATLNLRARRWLARASSHSYRGKPLLSERGLLNGNNETSLLIPQRQWCSNRVFGTSN